MEDPPPPAPDLMGPPPPPMGGGRGGGGQKVRVPNVVGLSEEAATVELAKVELVPEVKKPEFSLTREAKVLGQTPAADTELARKKKVALRVVRRTQQDDGNTEENKSSSVPREQMNALVKALADSTNPDLGFPAFTVSDCNSFHTTGYLWGLYAGMRLEKLDLPAGPVAVINFDQHDDTGDYRGTFVASDRWGRPLVSALRDLEFPALYLTVLNGRDDAAHSSVSAAGGQGRVPRLGSRFDAEKAKAFWKDVSDNYFQQPIKYVFVSVDRDCLTSCFNQWGDGGVADVEELKAKMKDILDPLLVAGVNAQIGVRRGAENQADTPPPAKLIGFDVTGMPEHQSVLVTYPPQVLKDNRDMRQPSAGQTPQAFALAQEISVERLRELNPPGVFDTWDPKDPPPVFFGYKQAFSTICANAWAEVKIQELFEFAEALPIPAEQEWSKVLYFSGSVGFGSGHSEFDDRTGLTTADRWDYVSNISRRVSDLLKADWKYVLCSQEAPMYKQGWKGFEIFVPGAALSNCATGQAAKEALGAVKARPGGFSCTASLTDFDIAVRWGWGSSVDIHDMLDGTNNFAH